MPLADSLLQPMGASPSDVAVFDASVLSDMFGDEKSVISAVLETFVSSMAGSMEELQAAIGEQDWAAAAGLAHRVKGAARMSGALALGLAALGLERHARAGEVMATLAAASELELQWLRVRDHLASRP